MSSPPSQPRKVLTDPVARLQQLVHLPIEARGLLATLRELILANKARLADIDVRNAACCGLSVRKYRNLKNRLLAAGLLVVVEGILTEQLAGVEWADSVKRLEAHAERARKAAPPPVDNPPIQATFEGLSPEFDRNLAAKPLNGQGTAPPIQSNLRSEYILGYSSSSHPRTREDDDEQGAAPPPASSQGQDRKEEPDRDISGYEQEVEFLLAAMARRSGAEPAQARAEYRAWVNLIGEAQVYRVLVRSTALSVKNPLAYGDKMVRTALIEAEQARVAAKARAAVGPARSEADAELEAAAKAHGISVADAKLAAKYGMSLEEARQQLADYDASRRAAAAASL